MKFCVGGLYVRVAVLLCVYLCVVIMYFFVSVKCEVWVSECDEDCFFNVPEFQNC